MAETGRVYGGRSERERRADRRDRLVAAGLALFGTEGWSGSTIEKLCGSAAVATRSFYEEFSSREALLKAVYEDVMADVERRVLAEISAAPHDLEVRTRAALQAYVSHLTEDPRRARVVHREIRIAGGLEAERHATALRFADVIETEIRLRLPAATPGERRILALALAGSVNEVLVDWVANPEPRPPTEPVVTQLVRLFLAALTPCEAYEQRVQG